MGSLRWTVLVMLSAGALGGCSWTPHETRAAYEPATDVTQSARPLALLPEGAGTLVAVLESRNAGVHTQRIVLSGDAASDGENTIIIQIAESERAATADGGGLPKPSEDGIARELDANFPTATMQISRAWSHNDFGPFGYAVGRAASGGECYYAWQYAPGYTMKLIDDGSRSAAASLPKTPTSLRVRLCRRNLSETDFVGLMRAMQVYPPDGGLPYHDTLYAGIGPLGAGDALQAAGAPGEFFLRPITPLPVKKVAKTHKRVAHRHVRHVTTYNYAPQRAPAASVVVPLPAGGSAAPVVITGASNPLLAPLQGAPAARRPSAAAADDMPLPNLPRAAGPAPAQGQTSSVPLPN